MVLANQLFQGRRVQTECTTSQLSNAMLGSSRNKPPKWSCKAFNEARSISELGGSQHGRLCKHCKRKGRKGQCLGICLAMSTEEGTMPNARPVPPSRTRLCLAAWQLVAEKTRLEPVCQCNNDMSNKSQLQPECTIFAG